MTIVTYLSTRIAVAVVSSAAAAELLDHGSDTGGWKKRL